MQTKTLNTEVLNNSTTCVTTVLATDPPEQQQQYRLHQQQQQLDQQQQQFHPSSLAHQSEQDTSLAPPVPPRIVLQAPGLVQDLSSSGPGDVSLPGAPSLHTHSSKFPIEREVIVKRGIDKQCKIPNLSEYMRRVKPSVAPDAPPKQVAWVQHKVDATIPMMDSSKDSELSPIRPHPNHNSGEIAGPATSTPEDGARSSGFPQRTYQSIKDIISSRFNNTSGAAATTSNSKPSFPETTLSPQSQLRQHGVYLANSVPQQPQHQHQQQHEMHTLRHPPSSQMPHLVQNQQRLCGPYQPQTPPQYKYQTLAGPYQATPNNQPPNSYPTSIVETPVWKHYGSQQESHNMVQQANDNQIIKCQSTENMYGPSCSGVDAYQGKQQPSELPSSVVKSFSQESIPASQMYNMSHYQLVGPTAAPPNQPFRVNRSHQQIARANGIPFSQSSTAANCAELGSANGHQYQTKQLTVHPVPPDQNENKLPPQSNSNQHSMPSTSKEPQPVVSSLTIKAQIEDDDEGGFVKRGAQSDSGRGSTVYSSAKTSEDTTPPNVGDPEWVDRVETELRNILSVPNAEGGTAGEAVPGGGGGVVTAGGGGSSESFSSMSPPLPPLSPQPSTDTDHYHRTNRHRTMAGSYTNKSSAVNSLWTPRIKEKSSRSHKHSKLSSNFLSGGLEVDSMLEENNSSEEDLEYTDSRAIRKQLEGLETMYAQVLKLLGVKKSAHGLSRYEASDPRIAKRRTCGSISSVPSSVSSRPLRDKRNQHRAKVRDMKGINRRFQRLESHVVTLARSVAHLSSEMRTQHIMMQEMEMMRGELAALRVQSNLQQQQQQQQQQQCLQTQQTLNTSKQPNSTPEKVKRLTKFFGDEPPLLRLFLRRLGYEKYASLFEKERIGLLELPFMSEERLHKLGIPLGPRLRIMQQAHLTAPNTLCVL